MLTSPAHNFQQIVPKATRISWAQENKNGGDSSELSGIYCPKMMNIITIP